MSKTKAVFYAIMLLGMTGSAYPEELGNRSAGYDIALEVCAECHAIEPGAKFSPNPLAPPFQDVADTPGMSSLALSVWSVTPHEMMPNFIFKDKERADIIAYILSLKSK